MGKGQRGDWGVGRRWAEGGSLWIRGCPANIDSCLHNVQWINEKRLCAGLLNVLKWSRDH